MILDLLDYRRRTAALYDAVRRCEDPRDGWLVWRRGRDELFTTHPQSPVASRDDFPGLRYAEYDPELRFRTTVYDAPRLELHVSTTDGTLSLHRIGRVELPVGSLDVWWVGGYGGGLFLPFADATNGTTTYGGGRYLLDTVKGADLGGNEDDLVIDFNFAYHPSCCYSAEWVCPLAPSGNRLACAIDAGELLPMGRSTM